MSKKKRFVYNLEFPSWCPEIKIAGYRFSRVPDYEEKVIRLQHLISGTSEFQIKATTGGHAQTAIVECPENENRAVLDWADKDYSALTDILLLLSIFSKREVFVLEPQEDCVDNILSKMVIVSDPREYYWGGILRCSIPYDKHPINPDPYGYDMGFEKGINQIYTLIQSEEWQKKYRRGFFLFLARMAFRRQPLEAAFIQCWTIWEHLFSILNQERMSSEQIRKISSVEKVSFILVKYALTGEIDKNSRSRIRTLADVRNRLIHYGKFPERGQVHDDADLFIRMTEFVIAKILGLSPSNVLNTVEDLESFLNRTQRK